MGRFKREKLVSGTAKSLVIRNLPRLQQLATPPSCSLSKKAHAS